MTPVAKKIEIGISRHKGDKLREDELLCEPSL